MGADMVLQIIYAKVNADDNTTAVSLCMVLLEELIDLSARCDDVDDLIGDMIRDILDRMEDTLESASPCDRAAIRSQIEQYIAERQSVRGDDCNQLQELEDVILDRLDEE